MGKLTKLIVKNYPNFISHKLYVYCDLYESIKKFYELDAATEAMVDKNVGQRWMVSQDDKDASVAKFTSSKSFNEGLLNSHKAGITYELNIIGNTKLTTDIEAAL